MRIGLLPRNRGTRRAAAMVEMAMVLPIFFLVVLGIVEFGRALMTQEVLVAAAREAARKGVIPSSTDQMVKDAATNILSAVRLPTAKFTTVIKVDGQVASVATAKRGQDVTVTVSVLFKDVALSPPNFLIGNKTLTAGCTMRRE